MEETYIEVGKIVGTRGIKGEVKVVSWCDAPSDFELFSSVWIKKNGGFQEYLIQSLKYIKNNVALILDGVDTLESAQKLIGSVVFAQRDDFGLEEDEYFIQDLIGISVVLEDGTPFGRLTEIFQTGSNDVYCVKTKQHGMVYLPCIKDVVKKVDLKANTVTVRLIEGILD